MPQQLPKRGAKIRLRGGSSPLWAKVHWPAEPPGKMLVHFADDQNGDADWLLSELAQDPGLLVLSASCTQASEAIEVTEWSADHADDLGASAEAMFVAGAGVAGRLAARVALHARDCGWPTLAGQILVDPHFEPVPTGPGSAGPYPAPLRARVAGVAPATMVTTTRDDGRRYAERLRRAQVPVDEITLRTHGPVVLLTTTRKAVAQFTAEHQLVGVASGT